MLNSCSLISLSFNAETSNEFTNLVDVFQNKYQSKENERFRSRAAKTVLSF